MKKWLLNNNKGFNSIKEDEDGILYYNLKIGLGLFFHKNNFNLENKETDIFSCLYKKN